MQENPWHTTLQAALKRLLPPPLYLRYVGRHEQGSLRIWREHAARCTGAILDVGAFRGEYALAARAVNPNVPIYAFEPNPLALEPSISVEQLALAEHSGEVLFLRDTQRSQIVSSASGDIIQVPAVSLDDWCAQQNVQPSLIKIDTEGQEAAIIRGGRTVIAKHRPVILCEVLSNSAGRELAALLPSYRYFRIDEDHGTEERQQITREHWRHKNWLLLPH